MQGEQGVDVPGVVGAHGERERSQPAVLPCALAGDEPGERLDAGAARDAEALRRVVDPVVHHPVDEVRDRRSRWDGKPPRDAARPLGSRDGEVYCSGAGRGQPHVAHVLREHAALEEGANAGQNLRAAGVVCDVEQDIGVVLAVRLHAWRRPCGQSRPCAEVPRAAPVGRVEVAQLRERAAPGGCGRVVPHFPPAAPAGCGEIVPFHPRAAPGGCGRVAQPDPRATPPGSGGVIRLHIFLILSVIEWGVHCAAPVGCWATRSYYLSFPRAAPEGCGRVARPCPRAAPAGGGGVCRLHLFHILNVIEWEVSCAAPGGCMVTKRYYLGSQGILRPCLREKGRNVRRGRGREKVRCRLLLAVARSWTSGSRGS